MDGGSGILGISLDRIEKRIIDIHWDSNPVCYETKSFSAKMEETGMSPQAIVIDNGSYECRCGWSSSDKPNLAFRSLVAKPKQQMSMESFMVGNRILEFEQGKLHKKSPFEKNIIAHFGTQEHILDHIFSNFNIKDASVPHPIVMTEAFCNLNISRKNTTEMLFELYGVPSLCYGVDFLLSYYHNALIRDKPMFSDNSLIISSSYQTTHIVPILNGKVSIEKSRRISIGSDHSKDLLIKSLHLKYPELKQKFTNELIQYLHENYTMTAKDYSIQLKVLEALFKEEQNKLKQLEIIQIFGSTEMYHKAYAEENIKRMEKKNRYSYLKPYTNFIDYRYGRNYDDMVIPTLFYIEKPRYLSAKMLTEEEIKAKQEMRQEQSRRLKELMQKKREENFKQLEYELKRLEDIASLRDGNKFSFEEALVSNGYSSYDELQKRMTKIINKLNYNNENPEDKDIEKRWAFINIPDEDLTEDQIKTKRIQKMQRNAYLSRQEKREAAQKERERIEALKQQNPEKYLVSLYRSKKDIIDRLEHYKQIRKDMTNRHSKANMKRMKMIAELGKEGNDTKSSAKKKNDSSEDEFGSKDEDWEIYRGISRHNLSDEEEEDQQKLHEIEVQISEMDPNYFKGYANQGTVDDNVFALGVDQFRGPELVFKPYIIGVDQAGVTEIAIQLFKTLSQEKQKALAENVFTTGGNTKSPFFCERITNDLRSNLSIDNVINVLGADDPVLDAWKGGCDFYRNFNNREYFITKEEYNEYGLDYFKEHFASNLKVNKLNGKQNNDLFPLEGVVGKRFKI